MDAPAARLRSCYGHLVAFHVVLEKDEIISCGKCVQTPDGDEISYVESNLDERCRKALTDKKWVVFGLTPQNGTEILYAFDASFVKNISREGVCLVLHLYHPQQKKVSITLEFSKNTIARNEKCILKKWTEAKKFCGKDSGFFVQQPELIK